MSDVPQTLRIVSLSPAISHSLVDLELDKYLVGRTPFCEAVDRSIPVVGDLLDLNMELLVRVRPTHVVLQPPAGGINPALVRLANERGWAIGAWHLDSIDDVRVMIGELPDVISDGDLLDDEQRLVQRATEMLQRIDESLREDEHVFRGPALLVFGLEPVTVFGEGTYLDEVLTALGGRNAITHRGYPQFSLEDIARMKPEAVILVSPGADNERSPRERLGAIARLDIPAVHNDRLRVMDHPDGLLPSSGIIGVANALRELLTAMRESPVEESNRRDAETQRKLRSGTTEAQRHREEEKRDVREVRTWINLEPELEGGRTQILLAFLCASAFLCYYCSNSSQIAANHGFVSPSLSGMGQGDGWSARIPRIASPAPQPPPSREGEFGCPLRGALCSSLRLCASAVQYFCTEHTGKRSAGGI